MRHSLKIYTHVLRVCTMGAALLILSGCWNGKDQFHKYQDEGHARDVPLIVYDFTSNDPTSYQAAVLGFAFVNTQAASIDSLELELSICNTMGQATRPLTLKLSGPFDPGASFVIAPMGPMDARGHQQHVTIPHAVVTSITVGDASGAHRFDGKRVADLLDAKIANYCIGRAM
jgi:hypothetical protein